jgi:hypothetical protein
MDEGFAERIRSALRNAFPDVLADVQTELQDGGRFLLTCIYVSESVGDSAITMSLDAITAPIERLVPKRTDEYAWMLNVYRDGRLVASRSGGWALSN